MKMEKSRKENKMVKGERQDKRMGRIEAVGRDEG